MSRPSASTTEASKTGPWGRRLPPLLFLLAVAASVAGLGQGMDRDLGDLLVRARIAISPLALSPRIVPVDLDDSAERNLGSRVDDRGAFASLLTVLGEGRLRGAMDFLFLGARDPAIDRAMAEAAGRMDVLVLAVVPISKELSNFSGKALEKEDAVILRSRLWHPRVVDAGRIPVAATFLMPNRSLAEKARFLGHIAVSPDSDGLYRRVPLLYRWEDGYLPSLGLALAVADLGIDPAGIEVRAGDCLVLPRPGRPPILIPMDDHADAWIPWPGLWNSGWKRLPLDKVVAAAADTAAFDGLIGQWDGRLVLAADLTTTHKDFGTTPLESVYPLSGIHTSLLNGILTDTFYRSASWWQKLLSALFLLAAVAFVARSRRDRHLHLGFAALVAILALASSALWFLGLTLPWFSAPALGLAAAWLGAAALRLFRSHEDRVLLENTLSRYFPRALAVRVLGERRADLKPESKELSILFADISNFTGWSSDKSPELVHEFLSNYLDSMSAILFEHGATVDKFMGDGIMAFFGDPVEQPDHAARALRAALAMQVRAREIAAEWRERAAIDLRIRIGVNSGRVIVGNLGSKSRIEYTVIGAAVNLAQRMEGNAPVGGILVSSATRDLAGASFVFGGAVAVKAKGYDEPVGAYVLEGEVDTAAGSAPALLSTIAI
ncbi:MAG: adenylate/guanylate cyclase domain-containing protein [Spirochaetota bacterium]